MKGAFYIIIFIFFSVTAFAQNLVPNGGFESFSVCPTSTAQLSGYCNGWNAYSNGTPDYYNACNTGSAGIPNNANGFQAAASGNAYAGVVDYAGASVDFKEYITTGITPLQAGATYLVSIMVSLADNAANGSNGLGVYFFKNAPASVSTTNRLTVTPQISYASYGAISNKTGWVKLTKTFVADSTYDHIVIGGFLDNTSIQTSTLSGPLVGSYYYIDSVSVKFADTVSLNVDDTILCVSNTIQVPYTVNAATPFNTGNTFTLQLSDNAGGFATPINIGSVTATTSGSITGTIPSSLSFSSSNYRMRIVATNPPYISADNGKNIGIGNAVPIPVAHITSPACENDTFTLSVTSPTNITDAVWNGPKFNNTHASSITVFHAKLTDAGIYTVKVSNYGCSATATGNLIINTGPAKPIGSSNSPLCSGDTLVLSGQTTGINDSWLTPGGTIAIPKDIKLPAIALSDSGDYILRTTLNGCTSRDTVHVKVKATPVPAATVNAPCEGSTLNISSSYAGAATKYIWVGPSGYTSLFQNNQISNASSAMAGKYYITITGANGCMGVDSVTAIIKPMPANTHITGGGLYCEGDTIQLQASNSTAGVVYSWSGPGGFTSDAVMVRLKNITTAVDGKYIVTADLNGCGSKDSANITVKHKPVMPDAKANTPLTEGMDLQLQVSNQVTGVSYSWAGPLGFTAATANAGIQAITVQNSGTYIVTANENGCFSSNFVLVTVDAKTDSSILEVYPNPSNGNFTIKSSVKFDQQVPIRLYNDGGSLVYKTTVDARNKFMTYTVLMKDALASGVYMLHLIIDGSPVTRPVVVKR